MNIFSSSKNDYCLHLFNKHLEFQIKVFEEKLEHVFNTYRIVKNHFAQLSLEQKIEPNGQ